MKPPNEPELRDPAAAEAHYANFFEVGYNAFEFLLAFGQSYANDAQEQLHTRLVMGPRYAKELLRVLEQSLKDYEKAFGTIVEE